MPYFNNGILSKVIPSSVAENYETWQGRTGGMCIVTWRKPRPGRWVVWDLVLLYFFVIVVVVSVS